MPSTKQPARKRANKTPSPTKTGTVRLSEIAHHVVVPKRVVRTGFPSVAKKAAQLGVRFRPWQPDVGRLILAKREDGLYASTIGGTGLSIPRQVGKTFLVGVIVFCLCLLRPGLTVIWTSHRMRTAEETFAKMLGFSRRRRIAPFMLRPKLGAGEQAIRFRNRSRILFGARERGFGRGFDEVDVLIFDEAQILTDAALDDMIPATNQSRQPEGALVLFMMTPPTPKDPSEVATRMRTDALSGDDEDTGWVEFSADQDFEPTEKPAPMRAADWRQIAKANPSFPDDTPKEAFLRMRKHLTPESMKREGYGIWDETGDVFEGAWSRLRVDDVNPPAPLALGLAVSLDGRLASLAVVGRIGDRPVVGVQDRRRGTKWVVPECVRLSEEYGLEVAVHSDGPADFLIPKLERAGVTVNPLKTADYCAACSDFEQLVKQGIVGHLGHDELDVAVLVAVWRDVGDGRKAWGRRRSTGDISMLDAATCALWGEQNNDMPAVY